MRFSLPLLAVLAAATAAQAATITVPVDQSRRLPIGGSAASVVIGNTEIADVRVVDSRTIMVIGKRPGLTNIVAFDTSGRALIDEQVQVSAGQGAAVSVFRGGDTTDYACSPYCASVGEQKGVQVQAPAPASPAAAP